MLRLNQLWTRFNGASRKSKIDTDLQPDRSDDVIAPIANGSEDPATSSSDMTGRHFPEAPMEIAAPTSPPESVSERPSFPETSETHPEGEVQPTEDERREAYWRLLKPAFTAKQPALFAEVLAAEYGLDASVVFDPAFAMHPTCFVLTIEDARLTFRFSAAQIPDVYTVLIVERWWAILPLIKRLTEACGDEKIETIFNLNDEGIVEGLAFCDRRPAFSLIPDCVFVGMKGYAHIKDGYAARNIPWEDKADVVFWRGTSTGCAFGEQNELPRISLCRLCRSDPSGIFDVGLTALVDNLAGQPTESELQSLVSDYVEWYEFDRYRYHIDIDGHTNSWPGLMFKLHSGGLVFKVDSPGNYRQWYYDRLRPWENFVPVKSDLSDLLDLVAHFRRHESLGRAIAEEGRRLAQSMVFSTELDAGVRTILGRSARDAYLRAQQ